MKNRIEARRLNHTSIGIGKSKVVLSYFHDIIMIRETIDAQGSAQLLPERPFEEADHPAACHRCWFRLCRFAITDTEVLLLELRDPLVTGFRCREKRHGKGASWEEEASPDGSAGPPRSAGVCRDASPLVTVSASAPQLVAFFLHDLGLYLCTHIVFRIPYSALSGGCCTV